ncbi:NADH:flavin oxidoreductase/NADH oxidase family protein [Venturia nashicola]|uniref:NADH:flavin oxidoreductase/NADH oxidase family protein n=1 Tax=Venturia nashicola TaxID=86259 RepID=A0A4Z1PB55_9PEZI|nr:NADH:flavin oxidoreductase/NADH oxidase family protein [Venturia nashicola]TLD36838.1 NADH:flavin oxidoreductase/NADH oxidase family protein [Venturia nashicola]
MAASKLFTPLQVGKMALQNRLVMAPLTRFRANDNNVPLLPMVKEYYHQRSCVPGTLLITEATYISPQAQGYPNAPGLFKDEQLKAWKEVTDAVHKNGSFIYCQLWAMGRAAVPAFMKSQGLDMISSSATPMDEKSETPRALREDEIEEFIKAYASAAKAAVEVAGFDGVEIHAANGYLIDQFTQDTCNKRTDKWGGSVENRSRFGTAVATAVVEAVGAERVGIRLSPWSTFQGMRMANPVPQFTHLINNLQPLNLAYLHLVESRIEDGTPANSPDETWNRSKHSNIEALDSLAFAFNAWGKQSPIFLAGGFKPKEAYETVDGELKDQDVCIVFGRYWISNPDLVFRIREGIEFTKYDRNTFYKAKSVEGYTDYAFSKEWEEKGGKL